MTEVMKIKVIKDHKITVQKNTYKIRGKHEKEYELFQEMEHMLT